MLAENHYRLGILFNLLLQFTDDKKLRLCYFLMSNSIIDHDTLQK